MIFNIIMWIFEGIAVGFGAILPGVSGGTLCAAFGMYRPLIEILSEPKRAIKKYWFMALIFILGVGIGFVGLSGLANFMLEKDAPLITFIFIGFIIGTMPELWQDAGEQGRGKASFIAAGVAFALMLALLQLIKMQDGVTVSANFAGYILCGILWGLSFIVPGLSSSSLLLFFGLYQPMLEGISSFDFGVLIPMGTGMAACVLLLSRAIAALYKKFYSVMSHSVIGIVAATVLMIIPSWEVTSAGIFKYLLCIVGGCTVSFLLTRICGKLKEKTENNNATRL